MKKYKIDSENEITVVKEKEERVKNIIFFFCIIFLITTLIIVNILAYIESTLTGIIFTIVCIIEIIKIKKGETE